MKRFEITGQLVWGLISALNLMIDEINELEKRIAAIEDENLPTRISNVENEGK